MLYLCTDTVHDSLTGYLRAPDIVRLTAEQIYLLGGLSLTLIFASNVATGAVMALQFGNGLQRFGGTMYVPELVGLSVLRELGPVLTGLLLAGRVGSGMTAELASMNVTEQIDAIRALGDSPYATLVLPRLLACLICFPILTLFGDWVSIGSAMVVSYMSLSIGPLLYFSKTLDTLTWADFWTGIIKALVFGFFVAVASCWRGLTTTEGTRGVGASSTWIVVRSSIFILVADFFLSKIFILTVLKHG
jgi:phospholipid/cholesterol/gamma-HCH transport system permease protein